MKRIISKKKEEKRRRKNQIIVSVVLVFLMLFSVLGYAFRGEVNESENQKIEYNGFEFIKVDDFWRLEMQDYKFIFKYNPLEIEKINSDLKTLENYKGKPLYYFSENNAAIGEIYVNLKPIVQRFQPACLKEEKCEEDVPVKNCENNFIIIKESGVNVIRQEENCVFIEGNLENLTQISDAFLFKIIGVE